MSGGGGEPVVVVRGLRKSYGSVVAVEDLNLTIARGEVFGIVGPNGAGKSTAVECMVGLRMPDSGELRVLGLDPRTEGRELRLRIGVELQQASLPGDITVREALWLFASLYPHPADPEGLLEAWGLGARRRARFATLSGGQKQRLFVALALVNDPEVVFLDELTSGLDPEARRESWEMVLDLRERGKTVVLVTHSMEEAERLCDRVAILDRGRLLALDAPPALVRRFASVRSRAVGGDRLRKALRDGPPSLEDVYFALTGSQRAEAEGVNP